MRHAFQILATVVGLFLSLSGSATGATPRVVPPRVIDEPVWRYPLEAERNAIRSGEAGAILNIGEEGQLLDYLIAGCTHPAFARAVAEALPSYRFAAALVRGEPSPVRMLVMFTFQQEGAIVSFTGIEGLNRQLDGMTGRSAYVSWLCPADRLDRPLAMTKVVSPRYPDELRSRAERGEIEVDFFVDGQGRVRMPAISAGAHPSFAREAIVAVREWEFEPPTSGGRPAIVRVTQVFRFAPPSPPDSARR